MKFAYVNLRTYCITKQKIHAVIECWRQEKFINVVDGNVTIVTNANITVIDKN